ncbi:glycosyl transferase family 2 [Clostridium sp. DL-VIII]|uniref:glycosyltransferase n=1 Tax=Clostridium sp. DL-VIII TaxID=641107 RepID=UPI00023AFC6C|nr:glycosyltransferase [Clostridium sp. DL-VIII]EHJ00171.1 glycosyl transferase family 2 [Clostridium sp. DL-VIII]
MEQNLGSIIKKEAVTYSIRNEIKLIFFVKKGMDSFLDDIIDGVSKKYNIKKVIITEYKQIDEGMEWADICWFEWCDDLIAYGSKLELAKEKKIICRLHSYEAFNGYINDVNWSNVNSLIVICEHIKNFIVKNFNINERIISIIPNGIDEKKWSFKERENGFNIVYVGYINYKKGPMLLLHTFKAIYDKDNRYKLYIAGIFQDNRDVLYYNQMIQEFGIENNVIYEGWQDDLDKWLNDKDYILCTSILESQNVSVMQAMCKGIKPIIHNFVGSKNIYDKKYVWNTIGEAISMIEEDNYASNEYKKYIVKNFSLAQQIDKVMAVIDNLKNTNIEDRELLEKPLVTVGITNYNNNTFLDKCIESVLKQTYKNVELIIVDDCSTDDSIKKIKFYEEKYSNIRAIFHEKNSGSPERGIEEIISQAKGEYVMKLDADDYLDNERALYEFISIFIENLDLDYVYCNLKLVDKDGIYQNTWKYKQFQYNEIISETFNRGGSGVIPIGTGVYKISFFRMNNLKWYDGKNMRIAVDTLNSLIFLKSNIRYEYIDKDLICYRQHENNITYDLKNRIKSIIYVMEYIVSNFSETIYLKDINWSTLTKEDVECTKGYLIGTKYYRTFIMYLRGEGMPWKHELNFDIEQIKLFLQPLINIAEKYLKKSLHNNNLYSEDINVVLKELNKYKMNVRLNKATEEYSIQSQIVKDGKVVRKNLLEQYKDKYKNKYSKLLIYSPTNGYWKYSFLSWKETLNYMGIEVDIIYKINTTFDYSFYNSYITIGTSTYIYDSLKNKTITNIKNKIGIISVQLNNDELDLINVQLSKQFNFKFLISSLAEETNDVTLYNWISNNIKIINLPFAFNPLNYYPEDANKIYDYFFVGTNSYVKYKETEKYLTPILSKYNNGILRGIGWGKDIPELYPSNTNFFYNRAKINLNYHLDIQKQNRSEVNERTFSIASCGAFQLVDNPKLIYELYSEDDMVIANDEYEYIEKFEYYLNKPLERLEKSYNALVKTYKKDYSLFKVLENFLKLMV